MLIDKFKLIFKYSNLVVFILLLLSFVLRIYRINELLDFHYDQGRDALVIWDLWHRGKFFLIGPVTGLDGVFLGPFYYYLIAPFYLLGKGNPVFPSIFLSFLTTLSLFFLYKSGELLRNKTTGLLALFIGSFSNFIIFSNRWLSNPTPIYLSSILIFYNMLIILKTKKKNYFINWIATYFLVGLSFHFESASAIFYLPVLAVYSYWQRKKINLKVFVISSLLLFSNFLPQLIFNLRHNNLILNNIMRELPKTDPQTSSVFRILLDRMNVLWGIFAVKIFPQKESLALPFSLISLFGIYKLFSKQKDPIKLFFIFLIIPLFGYLIYRGNHGVLYDYYLTGYYLILILFFAYGLSYFWDFLIGKLLIILFLILFLVINLPFTIQKLNTGVFDGNDIYLANQLAAINWIYSDAKETSFNVDIYVPPVIFHSYNYLFTWLGDKRSDQNQKLLYTLYELDPEHNDRLIKWQERQKGIARVISQVKFGGIVVEKRERILYE